MLTILIFYFIIFLILFFFSIFQSLFFIKTFSIKYFISLFETKILFFIFHKKKIDLFLFFFSFLLCLLSLVSVLDFLSHSSVTFCQSSEEDEGSISSEEWEEYVDQKTCDFTQKLIDINKQKEQFDILKEHTPLEYLKALLELQKERVELRSLLSSFFYERFPFESILECSKQLNVSLESDNMLMQVVKNKMVEQKHLDQLEILFKNNEKLQKESDNLINKLLEKSSQIEEKKNN